MTSPSDALIVAAGAIDDEALAMLTERAAGGPERPLIVAADGGAARCLAAGVRPDIVVGDLDSLDSSGRAGLDELGVELRVAKADKDESDMELSLLTALEAGVTRITVLGALGIERPEHGIANLLLLADSRLDGLDVSLVGPGSRLARIGSLDGPGEMVVTGSAGDFVSLLPLGATVDGVSSVGLRFPLHGETLPLGPSRGLSNELLGSAATVRTRRGCLLVVHTRRAGSEEER
jgi:thiamine pyrophosphokinase